MPSIQGLYGDITFKNQRPSKTEGLYGDITFKNQRPLSTEGLYGDITFRNQRSQSAQGLYGDITFLLYKRINVINARVAFISSVWPHKVYGVDQSTITDISTGVIQKATDVDKNQYP